MNIQNHLHKQLEDVLGVKPSDTLICAVSGGVDSMALLAMLHKLSFKLIAAHCNFGLRGDESDADTKLVEQFCADNKIKYYAKHFDTPNEKQSKENTQLAARRLRFTWFEELRKETKSQYVVLAHHNTDSLETFFINLFRGSGVKGLKGIKAKSGTLLRPFLDVDKEQLYIYAEENNIPYREDASNFSDAYERNKIRMYLLPLLRNVFPKALQGINKSLQNIRKANAVEQHWFNMLYQQSLVSDKDGVKSINVKRLPEDVQLRQTFFYRLFEPLGFTSDQVANMAAGVKTHNLEFESLDYIAYIKATRIDVVAKTHLSPLPEIQIPSFEELQKLSTYHVKLVNATEYNILKQNTLAQLDYKKISWPISIRPIQEGDNFSPLGLKGNKSVSRFLKDEKASAIDKKRQLVWVDTSGIFWLEGHRIDNHYKVHEKTEQVLVIMLK